MRNIEISINYIFKIKFITKDQTTVKFITKNPI
jgi:hypothetical protein